MNLLHRTLASLFLVAVFLVAVMSMPAHAQRSDLLASPKIVLVRGWMDVFSTGLDDLAGRLRQSGYSDVSVISLTAMAGVERELILSRERRGPIVLIGHSLGANAAVGLAQRLGERGIPIGLLVSFDATESLAVPANVERVLNIYQPIGSGRSLIATGGGFRGEMVSIDMSRFRNVSHTNIEKAENLHLLVIETISRLQRSAPRRAISQIN
jgi:hypothetical protein